jgi:hypothetical protein
MNRTRFAAALAVGALAMAELRAGLFEDIYRGLDVLATPSGFPVFPSPDGGFGNGQRQGRLRIVPDRAGRGYTLEFDRTFGVDTRGRPEVLDLGAYELELNGSMQATAGYTSRGYLVGNYDFAANNLNYRLTDKTGLQDYELTGTLNVVQSMEVNAFGFYTLQMQVSNANSTLTQDGVIIRDTEDVSFDVGPINVEGNIYFDALVTVLGAIGVDTTELAALSPKSPVDRIAEELQAQFENAARVAGVSVTAQGDTVVLNDATRQRPQILVGPQPLPSADDSAVAGAVSFVPEPGTLLLLGIGAATFGVARRRG